MSGKFLAAVALAITLVPAVASAQGDSYGAPARPVAERAPGIADHVSTFVTRVIFPQPSNERPIPYADNPELIGSRYGASDPAWHK